MGLDKSRLKALMAEGFAADLFGSRDKYFQETFKHKGSAEAFVRAEKELTALSQKVRGELISNGVPFDPNDPVAVGRWIVEKLMEGARIFHKLAEGSSASALRAEGQQLGVELAIDKLSKVAAEENAKAEAAEMAAREGRLQEDDGGDLVLSPSQRIPGRHPGPPMKALRQSEVASSTPDGGDRGQDQADSSEPPETRVAAPQEAQKKSTVKRAKPKAAGKPKARKPSKKGKSADAKNT